MVQPNHTQPGFDFEAVFEVDDYLYFYSELLTEERTEAEIAFLVREVELAEPRQILDLACGFGRHANRLAALGHAMIGIDLAPGFLEIARRDAVARGVSIVYRQGDMRHIDYQEQFDRVLLLFTAFGYFEDEQNLQVLKNVRCVLKPGGLLVFDIHHRDVFLKGFLPFSVIEKEGNLMIDRNSFDSISGRLYNQRIVIRDGFRKDKPYFIRMYNPSEIRDLLSEAGLEVYKMYGGMDSHTVSNDSRRLIVIAKKAIRD